MTDDTPTNWVTVKVPEEDRDRARDYLDDANERLRDGTEELTYGDAIVAGAERLNDHLDSDTSSYVDTAVGPDEIAQSVVDALDDMDSDPPAGWDTDALEELLARTEDAEFVPLEARDGGHSLLDGAEPWDGDELAHELAREIDTDDLADEIASRVASVAGPSEISYDEIAERVSKRVGYDEAQLAQRVADELEVRLG